MSLTRAIDSAVSGVLAQQIRLDVVGDNLANVSTPGFRGARVDFASALSDTLRIGSEPERAYLGGVDPLQIGLGVEVAGVTRSFDVPGAIVTTGIAGDVAIDGDGFFRLEGGGYTRDGSFGVDASGRFVDPATGLAVLGENDGVLLVPAADPSFTGFSVGADGTLTGNFTGGPQALGRITLARFANPEGLELDGLGLFRETAASGDPIVGAPGTGGLGTLVGGALESSNVDATAELGELISAQRAYLTNARALRGADRLLEDLVKIV